jgi:hypothetical protein
MEVQHVHYVVLESKMMIHDESDKIIRNEII